MKNGIRAVAGVLICASLCTALCCRASAQDISVSAYAAVLTEAFTGQVLYEKNADVRLPMASTTKLFTALIICESCSLDEVVTVPRAAAAVEGSSSYLAAGDRLTVEQLLYALLLSSGNDAAETLAIHAGGGDRDAFISRMNSRAQELGLANTHFSNPSGLPAEDHYTTARELALIGCMASADPVVSRIAATETISFTAEDGKTRSYYNHNSLLRMYEYASGLKTGYTKAAGRCLVSSARRDGVSLVCVTLNAPDDWDDHMRMLDYGFTQLNVVCVYPAGSLIALIPVCGGKEDFVQVVNSADIVLPLNEDGLALSVRLSSESFLFAPVLRGARAGTAYVDCGGRVVAQSPLVTVTGVAARPLLPRSFGTTAERILNFLLL